MSFFITFEGIEGSGKTTQLALLAERLRRNGLRVLTTREPGGCPIADAIRRILLDPVNRAMAPRAELLLYAAARAQHVAEVIRPALAEGRIVLCDRYTDATLAYQGYGRQLDMVLIDHLNEIASEGCRPDLTLLLDMPETAGLERALQRNATQDLAAEGRFEQETLAFHGRVRQGYLEVARRQPARFRLIDARGGVEEVAGRIASAVDAFFAGSERS
jgi:dTMP kinase